MKVTIPTLCILLSLCTIFQTTFSMEIAYKDDKTFNTNVVKLSKKARVDFRSNSPEIIYTMMCVIYDKDKIELPKKLNKIQLLLSKFSRRK
jgi:hypothetical protein